MDKFEYEKAIKTLDLWAKAYYVDDEPIATDEEYDALYRAVENYERENNITSSKQVNMIGTVVKNDFKKISHISKMWSMEDALSEKELPNNQLCFWPFQISDSPTYLFGYQMYHILRYSNNIRI